MPKFEIIFDSDNNSFEFKKAGRPVENLNGVYMSCYKEYDGAVVYHLSYSREEENEIVSHRNEFRKEKDDEYVSIANDEKSNIDIPAEATKVVKQVKTRESLGKTLSKVFKK